MAPRRGGGGSSSGGGSSDSGSSDSDNNPWFYMTELFGSGFTIGYAIAVFVFVGIFFFLLLGIAFWAMSVKKRGGQTSRSVLKGWKFGVAVFFGLISFGFGFAEDILYEAQTAVVTVFFMIAVILDSTVYIAGIWLLATVYSLLHHCLIDPNDARHSSKSVLLKMHYLFCGILFALYLVILAFDIRDVVVTVNRYGDPIFLQYSTTRTIPVDNKLDVAFSALYFVASIEVLLGSVWVLLTAHKHGIPKKVGLRLIGLVGVPLFLRRVFFLAYGARFELSFNYYETWGAVLAETIITGFCAILVYAGIVLVVVQVDKARCKPWAEDQPRDQSHPNGVAPPPAMQMYPDPTQGRYDVHEMQGQPDGHTRF